MLRSWTEELHIVMRERHLELGVVRLGKKVARSTLLDWSGSETDPARATEAIRQLGAPTRWRLRIGGWHALHGVLPWPAAATPARQSAALADLQQRHALEPTAHLACVLAQGFGRPCPYWAVERELVESWQQLARMQEARITAVESLLLAQVSALRAELLPSTLLFIREDTLVHVCELHDGRWHSILSRAIDPGSTLATAGIIAEERRLRLQETLPVQSFEQLPMEQRPDSINPIGMKLTRGALNTLDNAGAFLGLQL